MGHYDCLECGNGPGLGQGCFCYSGTEESIKDYLNSRFYTGETPMPIADDISLSSKDRNPKPNTDEFKIKYGVMNGDNIYCVSTSR